MKLKVQCTACGEYIPLVFKPHLGYFEGMCPNKECQIHTDLQTDLEPEQFISNNTDVKHCEICGQNWVRKHTCKASLEHAFIKSLEELQTSGKVEA